MRYSLRVRLWLLLLGFLILLFGSVTIPFIALLVQQYDSHALVVVPDWVAAYFFRGQQTLLTYIFVIQAVILLLALLFFWWGNRVARQPIAAPWIELSTTARGIADGNLEQNIPTFAGAEFKQLADALEAIRLQILAGQREMEDRVDQRTRELAVAFEFSQEITAQLELDRLLDSVTERARTLMEGTSGALCLLEENNTKLCLAASAGDTPAPPKLRQPATRQLPTRIIQQGKTVVSETTCTGCSFLQSMPASRCVATPLRVGDTTMGALCVVRPATAPFDVEEQNAFALLGNAAAVAIVNARLVESGRAQTQHAAVQSERERLAAELHDNLAQTLSFLNFKADRLDELIVTGAALDHERLLDVERELAQMRGAMTNAYSQVRAALTGLNSAAPKQDALAAQLAACVEELHVTTGLPIELTVNDPAALILPATAQRQVLHIMREALLNVWRHAHAQKATVSVEQVNGLVYFSVSDDGRGFNPDRVDSKTHLGLAIMRARAERSGGSLIVCSQPGAGTRITAVFEKQGV
jgi:two-component system, NarL family, nitrate/nitrite sensor histidine kinase NarX